MGKQLSYSEKLKDQRWQNKRFEILKRDDNKCVECKSEVDLHIHHKFYTYGLEPWEYPDSALITLCSKCHNNEEYYRTELKGLVNDLHLRGHNSASIYNFLEENYINIPLPEYLSKENTDG